MNREERKKRRQRKRKLKFAFFAFILVYLFVRSLPSLGDKTTLPEEHIVEDIINTESIIIKNEKVYTADGEGKLTLLEKEGERVAVGTKVAELNLISDTSKLRQRLEEIDKRIEALSKADANNIINDNNRTEAEETNNLIDDIRVNINEGNYYEVGIIKDKLLSNRTIPGEDKLLDYSLESLKEDREELLNQISNNTIDYITEESGVLSYKIDDYESVFSISNKLDYKYSDFNKLKEEEKPGSNNDNFEVGESIFKIIDNFNWYMLIKIEDIEDVENYEIGNNIKISAADIEGDINGQVININEEDKKGTILCKFTDDFNPYYDKRFIEIDIVKNRYNSYKIPKKSLTELDDIKGVYIKDFNGIIRFRPIKILKEDDKSLYIDTGDQNNRINIGNDENIKTVSKFDEIILKPSKVKEGTIFN